MKSVEEVRDQDWIDGQEWALSVSGMDRRSKTDTECA